MTSVDIRHLVLRSQWSLTPTADRNPPEALCACQCLHLPPPVHQPPVRWCLFKSAPAIWGRALESSHHAESQDCQVSLARCDLYHWLGRARRFLQISAVTGGNKCRAAPPCWHLGDTPSFSVCRSLAIHPLWVSSHHEVEVDKLPYSCCFRMRNKHRALSSSPGHPPATGQPPTEAPSCVLAQVLFALHEPECL